MVDRDRIHEGMIVRGSDGKKVGRVSNCDEGAFVVEKGFFFVTDYTARYEDVADVSGDRIMLSRPRKEVAHHARALPREGGLGESATLGMAGYVFPEPIYAREPPSASDGHEWNDRSERRGRNAPTYGDEGGGGLL